MCWFIRQEENLALLQDILSGGHHLPSPEYTIPKEASFLLVKAKEGMQRACNYHDAKCYLWEAVWKLKHLCNKDRTAAFGCDRWHSCIGAWRAYFYKKDIYKKSFLVNHLEKKLKTLTFRQLKQL